MGMQDEMKQGQSYAGGKPGVMPFKRYPGFAPPENEARAWPSNTLRRAPRWCSVDLRDGNQALVEPMGWDRKIRLFETLVEIGFREIEVGFPAASATEFDFIRQLIEEERIPESVTIQVLTQCREDQIEKTFEAIAGAPRTILHFYNSTSALQRRVVFREGRAGIEAIAVRAAEQVAAGVRAMPEQDIRLEYTPESFSSTELDFAVSISEAVMETVGANAISPIILNLPSTVEVAMPNVYADQIEGFDRALANRDAAILSVHPHNDRGCGVAAAELAFLAGAERVEGTLFGNGERTGNVDLVTVALNLMTQGVDPELDFRDLPGLVRRAEHATRLPVHPRHPYAGELVFTAFSGSHQDAIRKGLSAIREEENPHWEVPYLPVDPIDLGRSYEAVIRINSQSGKGGIAFVLETEHGFALPRRMQIEFSQVVQGSAETTGEEIASDQIRSLFDRTYLSVAGAPRLQGDRRIETRAAGTRDVITASLAWGAGEFPIEAEGAGPLDAFVAAICDGLGVEMRVGDYHEHALGVGSAARAAAYVEIVFGPNRSLFGAGVAQSLVEASFAAVLSAIARAAEAGWIVPPAASPKSAIA